MTGATGPDFSFAVNLSAIEANNKAVRFDLTADADQRSALATRFGCVDIRRFEVTAMIAPLRKDGHFRVTGVVSARVVQNCVVSLEPVETDLEREFVLLLVPQSDEAATEFPFEDEDIETYSENMVDLGEIGAIELALALDPYPRAPGVSLTDLEPDGSKLGYEVSEEAQPGRNTPFGSLAALKRKG